MANDTRDSLQYIDEAIKMIGETPILEFKEQGTPSTTAAEAQKIKDQNVAAEKKAEVEAMKKAALEAAAIKKAEADVAVVYNGDLGLGA